MENLPVLQIDHHVIRLQINQGPDHIEFDADDILFIEGFYHMIETFQQKQVQYQAVLDTMATSADPASTIETIKAMKDICLYAHAQIDKIFGEGSSKKLFGNALAFEPIEQFFTGILPYIKQQRARRLKAFLPPNPKTTRPKKPRVRKSKK